MSKLKDKIDTDTADTKDDDETSPSPSLPKLLAALALGARSCNALPISSVRSNDDADDDNGDDDSASDRDEGDDEFAYQMAFREFHTLCLESRSDLASMLNRCLQSTATATLVKSSKRDDADPSDDSGAHIALEEDYEFLDFDDPVLWEIAAEACDVLLERVDSHVQTVKESRLGMDSGEKLGAVIGRVGDMARNRAKGGFKQIIGGLVKMEKPQIAYNFAGLVQNSRTEPFVPHLHPDRPFSLIKPPQNLELLPGHGLESKIYGGASADYLQSTAPDIVAPTMHYPHPYKDEIEKLEYRPYQLKVEKSSKYGTSGTLNNPATSSIKGVWIDTEDDLILLVNRINDGGDGMREIAIDLEAHNFRSFSGFVCLMQISLRRPTVDNNSMATILEKDESSVANAYDFVIDTLALWKVMNHYFAPIMANPDILKVMHGADSDVCWLQRDFGIYIVNLFDTGRASRALPHFSKAGLAYLLSKYANVTADKKHQLSDWRQRPLPIDMLSYAVSDTAYLLDIYDKVRFELLNCGKGESIQSVLDASKKVCLIRYDKEPFKPSTYKNLITSKRGKNVNTILSEKQDSLLKELFDWRDALSREEDESLQYVCGNTGLVRIATVCPSSVHHLKSCVNPLPPLVLKYAHDILNIVKRFTGKEIEESSSKSSDHIMAPPVVNQSPKSNSNLFKSGGKSPVLDTVELYEKAGWTTPTNLMTNEQDIASSSSDSGINISTQLSNSDFSSSKLVHHNLEMKVSGAVSSGRSQGVDGAGAAQEVLKEGNDGSDVDSSSINKQIIRAKNAAGRIRDNMNENQNLLRLVKTTSFINDDDVNQNQLSPGSNEGNAKSDDLEEFQIPKSVSEIYHMSNKNRRKSKKAPIQFSDDEHEIEDMMDLSQAEEIISKSGVDGKGYFQDISTKRQRTKSHEDDISEDVDLMVDLGWVKDIKEAENIIVEQNHLLESGEHGSGKERNRATDGDGSNNGNGKQNSRSRRGKRNNSSNIPYDYSKVGAIGVGGMASVGDNPFFAGASVNAGTLNKTSTNTNASKERERKKGSRKGGKRNNYSGGNKTHVYRK